jgi:hypothetical protein
MFFSSSQELFPEEPLRPQDQKNDKDHETDGNLISRADGQDAEGLDQPQNNPSNNGPIDTPQPPKYNDHKRPTEVGRTEKGREAIYGGNQ